jgi:hypothetical protein
MYMPGSYISLEGPFLTHVGLTTTSRCTFLQGYPQAVDNLVDNHVNYLQNQILYLRAIAL